MDHANGGRKHNKLGLVSGVYIPVCLNIFSILLFLRFGLILGQIGLVGMLGKSAPPPQCSVTRTFVVDPPRRSIGVIIFD